jgi:hypothetical protein
MGRHKIQMDNMMSVRIVRVFGNIREVLLSPYIENTLATLTYFQNNINLKGEFR